jgi:hypothetical protein
MREPQVILLPHPGWERQPDRGSICDWPPADSAHGRKFMCVDGTWRDLSGQHGSDRLVFWGEYEAPTRTQRLTSSPRAPGYPQFVHEIELQVSGPTLNTDPWVFYPGFVWTICLHGNAYAVRPGDVVLFGSTINNRRDWVVDTVLAVNRRVDHKIASGFTPPYKDLVLDTLFSVTNPIEPFVGTPFTDIAIPFSFVPCKIADRDYSPFPRLSISRLFHGLRKVSDDLPPSIQNSQALAPCRPEGGMKRFWNDLLHEVESQGLKMGTSFDHHGLEIEGAARGPGRCGPAKGPK